MMKKARAVIAGLAVAACASWAQAAGRSPAPRTRKIVSVTRALKAERARQEALRDCAAGGRDGSCAKDWSYLSPAEAKLAPRMSDRQLEQFSGLRYDYAQNCRKLSKVMGKDAKSPALCGADWSWLAAASLRERMKDGQEQALNVVGQQDWAR
ncbi:MAG TPA: hypothetical protein VNK24_01125 [Elusimicrobiota bacterium]|nr:hypothetical protein [Elusimicrobiota bacterium]